MSQSEIFMKRALELAEQGRFFVSPNPMVGAVLVKNGKIISEGFHEKYGEAHAEIHALNKAGKSAKGATLYVSLEPCSHFGKTPPCTQAIIQSGLKKVVVAISDPSEKVNGKGIQELRDAGIKVELGILEVEAKKLNEAFFSFHQKKRPYIALKAALSKDGKIAESRNAPTALTGSKARIKGHELRAAHHAILVGGGTVLADDPHLGTRLIPGRDPLRIVLEGKRKLPADSKIFRDKNILIYNEISVSDLLKDLYEKEVLSILVEGGQGVYKSFIDAGLVDRFHIFISPKNLGKEAISFYEKPSSFALHLESVQELDEDIYLNATPL